MPALVAGIFLAARDLCRHRAPSGPAFGRPKDKLRRAIQ
jgi:hypothetical protein